MDSYCIFRLHTIHTEDYFLLPFVRYPPSTQDQLQFAALADQYLVMMYAFLSLKDIRGDMTLK